MKFPVPEEFECDESIRPHLEKVFDGEYDVPIIALTGLTILDIGANVGSFALWAAERFPGSTIHCYEPHPGTFKILEKNLTLVRNAQMHAHPFGIGPAAGEFPLYEGKNNSGEATLFAGNKTASGVSVACRIKTPESLPEADILKIDAEGVEPNIVKALVSGGRKFCAIMLEYHRIQDRRDIDFLLEDYILTKAVISRNPNLGTVCYVRKDILSSFL